LPKQSGAEKLYKVIHDSGIQSALQTFDALKNAKGADYDLGETELNTLGYQLLYGDKRVTDSIAIFQLNTKEHPMSSNAFDSLGEAYWKSGDKDRAINCYQSAVKLDPANSHASEMLRQLK
jgi:tetratricopeptide (TPR) repeat protein